MLKERLLLGNVFVGVIMFIVTIVTDIIGAPAEITLNCLGLTVMCFMVMIVTVGQFKDESE